MKILHVIQGIQETCGVSRFVIEIARAQSEAGHTVRIVTSMTCGYPTENQDVEFREDPTETSFKPDIVHLHMVWSPYVHKMAKTCRKKGAPYVFSPHGAMARWALRYKWWKKLPAWLLYERRDFVSAAGIHVTSEGELSDVRRFVPSHRTCIASLGVRADVIVSDSVDKRSDEFLFLGRVHPVKNLDGLLTAWKAVKGHGRLVIAGPDDIGYKAELVGKAFALGLSVADLSEKMAYGKKTVFGGDEVGADDVERLLDGALADVVFLGPVYSEAKSRLLRRARCLVLPSHSENFGLVVLEALASGTPVIASDGTPWASLDGDDALGRCGWCYRQSFEGLVDALEKVAGCSADEYVALSRNATTLVRERYTWTASARKLLAFYKELT